MSLESYVAGSIKKKNKKTMKANRSETTGTGLKHMNDYQPGMCNATGSEKLSDFESLLSRVARFSSTGHMGTKNLRFKLKSSLATEGQLFIFLFGL